MGATRTVSSTVRMLGIAAAIGTAVLVAGNAIRLGRALPPPPPPAACLVSEASGLRPLDYVDNLETCGARLEVLYLTQNRPISGAYGGLQVFVDDQGIYAASSDGPRQRLVSPATRRAIDADILRLIQARRPKGVISLYVGPRAGL